ncbi:MAG TPA: CoA ligase [Flavobacteriales bacterium]|nr:CoA ligase [Flavobacteriales bacterium]
MLNTQLLNPASIAVIGASNDVRKPGGKVIKNILQGKYDGKLFAVNPNETTIQGIPCFKNLEDLPPIDLAILAIPAPYCPDTIEFLLTQNTAKAFIVLSSGFSETNKEGQLLEEKMVSLVNEHNACLIGPNCIGVINDNYSGVFTSPLPDYHADGCDLISSSGATAVFLMEAGLPVGLRFSSVFSVGNAAQTSAEDVLEYMDEHFDPAKDARIKLLYLESIKHPQKLLKHASSLIRKGAKIAAIKSGVTDAGSRAAASHTGALVTSDITVRALFRKAGVVYCSSREDLLTVASIFNYKKLNGKKIAVITHAGGSAVMLTDALVSNGLEVPVIEGPDADKLLGFLHPGSSVRNPIDFLATGNADQLGIIIDYCEHKFTDIDAMVVVFGSAGLFDVENVYNVLSVKLEVCSKPIFPVLPSIINAQEEIKHFLGKGNINFPDEVVLGNALAAVYRTPPPSSGPIDVPEVNQLKIREVIDRSADGFLDAISVQELLDAAGIPRVWQRVVYNKESLLTALGECAFPIVMKVLGPLHKSDVEGVVLNVWNIDDAVSHFERLMTIQGAEAVLIQPMIFGIELYMGVLYEKGFGRTIVCGLGGIFIEVLKDISAGLSPISKDEALQMIKRLKAYEIIKGTRGKEGTDQELFAEIIQKLSALTIVAPEISEMDMNPLIAQKDSIYAVDTRIRISRNQ